MGLSFAQTLGNAGQAFEDARSKNIAEKQSAAELQLKQQTMARSLQMEMLRLQLEKARTTAEEGRYAAEQERLKNAGWSKVGQEYQNPNGTWTSMWYNPATGEKREVQTGTPKAVAIQGQKGEQKLDEIDEMGKLKMQQITENGKWHSRWASIAAQGKLKKEDWNVLKTDPGYIQAVASMKSNLMARNMILAKMYSQTAPPSAEAIMQLNQQLQVVDQQLEQSSKAAEQVRNRVRFGVDKASPSIAGLVQSVQSGINKPKMQRARDRNGKLHEAPAGEPLPEGWTPEQ